MSIGVCRRTSLSDPTTHRRHGIWLVKLHSSAFYDLKYLCVNVHVSIMVLAGGCSSLAALASIIQPPVKAPVWIWSINIVMAINYVVLLVSNSL